MSDQSDSAAPTSSPERARSGARAVFCALSKSSLDDLVAIEAESNRPPWNLRLFSGEFTNPCSRVIGARLDGGLVAYMVCHIVLDECHIVNFGVLRAYRRQGIGSALLGHVLRELHREGGAWVTLEVRESNMPARKLYDAMGFVEVGVREAYYRDNNENGVTMRLNLSEFGRRLDGGRAA
jgi:ribosomal-protein-alanine N-acetyltransferase